MASTYTNFCTRPGGSNLNAGTLLGDTVVPTTTATWSYTGSFSTNTFTVTAGGNPSTDNAGGAIAGFVHCSDGTNIGRIARISSVTVTTIILSSSSTAGSGTGATQAKVGGAWAGPTGTQAGSLSFPFSFFNQQDIVNPNGNYARINMMQGTYVLTSAMTSSTSALIQGFTTNYGDLGRATLTPNGTDISIFSTITTLYARDMVFTNPGNVTNRTGMPSVSRGFFERCVFHDFGGYCLDSSGVYVGFRETEFYNGNMSNTASQGFLHFAATVWLNRCTFHGAGGGTNTSHISIASAGYMTAERCIFDSAGQYGVINTGTSSLQILHSCEFYNCGSHGFFNNGGVCTVSIENCNFCKNGGYGINLNQSVGDGTIYNCGFGVGTQQNTSGNVNYNVAASVEEIGTFNYTTGTTPWNSPGTGDFTIVGAAAENSGRGSFTSTGPSWSGTVGKPDVGAAVHAASAAVAAAAPVGRIIGG